MLLSVRYTLSNGRMWIMISRYMSARNLVIFGSTTGMTFVLLLFLTHGAGTINNSCYGCHCFRVAMETWMRSL